MSRTSPKTPMLERWLGDTPIGMLPEGTMNVVAYAPSVDGLAGPSLKRPKRGHQTQWAAQFAVASELCKRGYEVALTMGNNTPLADLMVVSPRGLMFLIDVKGLYRPNPWLIKAKRNTDGLYYVLAHVPTSEPNAFFVMTQQQVASGIQSELRRLKRPETYPVTGLTWGMAAEHKDAWHILPL